MIRYYIRILLTALIILMPNGTVGADQQKQDIESHADGWVATVKMDMMILPGTLGYLQQAIRKAEEQEARIIVVILDTPGGILDTSQQMIQSIFTSPVPIVVYVGPTGSTAASAGVFITMAGHIAAMAPGTSIGAAHPVAATGQDIEGDMRAKAENITVAMVKSITEERGRNIEWAEEAVRESASLTEKEALAKGVIDLVATDVTDLLNQIVGREVKVNGSTVKLGDYSDLSRREIEMGFQDRVMNVMANPSVAALLWLAATTGISLELYNPGAIIPGMVGIICLLLALAVSQVIPVSQSGVLLMGLGALLIGAEFYVGSGVLAIGGVVALIFGAIYLVDPSQAPGLAVALEVVVPVAVACGALGLWVVHAAFMTRSNQVRTGKEGLVGLVGSVSKTINEEGLIKLRGELWRALPAAGQTTPIEEGKMVVVTASRPGLVVEVREWSD